MQIEPTSRAATSALIGAASEIGTSAGALAAGAIDQPSTTSSMFGLSQDSFFKLFLTELQNQDPTQPLDNKAMLDQLGQFTMIDTLMAVQKTMQGVQLGQASGLIGKLVTGKDLAGTPITGVVSELLQSSGVVTLLVNGSQVKPDAITEVGLAPTVAAAAPATKPGTTP